MTKVHWTQRPGGKEKLAKALRKSHAARKAAKKGATKNGEPRQEISIKDTPTFAYALGHIEGWIEQYAKSAGVSSESLAAELGKVLQIKTRR